MVDDVAWGVGWGAAGDDAHAAHDEDTPARAASRTRPAELELIVPPATDWPADAAEHPHPSVDAAARRSSSRAQRSRSRAPVPTPTSSSSAAHRSRSRPPLSASASASSTLSAYLDAYALDTDTSTSVSPTEWGVPRGRRGASAVDSRSPSPSIAPRTPPDGARVAFADALVQPDELLLDGGARGRPGMRKGLVTPARASAAAVLELGGADGDEGHPRRRCDSLMSDVEEGGAQPCAHVMRVAAGVARMEVDCAAGAGSDSDEDMGRRTRPTSSPPIAPRTPLACSAPADGPVPSPEAFLRAGGAAVTAANMIARSRSAGAAQ